MSRSTAALLAQYGPKTVDRVNLVLGADIQYQNVYKGLKRERFDYYDTIFMGANIRFQRVSFDALSVLTS